MNMAAILLLLVVWFGVIFAQHFLYTSRGEIIFGMLLWLAVCGAFLIWALRRNSRSFVAGYIFVAAAVLGLLPYHRKVRELQLFLFDDAKGEYVTYHSDPHLSLAGALMLLLFPAIHFGIMWGIWKLSDDGA